MVKEREQKDALKRRRKVIKKETKVNEASQGT
jgi:hypothetical protein